DDGDGRVGPEHLVVDAELEAFDILIRGRTEEEAALIDGVDGLRQLAATDDLVADPDLEGGRAVICFAGGQERYARFCIDGRCNHRLKRRRAEYARFNINSVHLETLPVLVGFSEISQMLLVTETFCEDRVL